jgi:hypothetical protein
MVTERGTKSVGSITVIQRLRLYPSMGPNRVGVPLALKAEKDPEMQRF